MKLVLYRKYRPKTFSEILGHETNISILKKAASQDKIGHAYIFYGPRGTGKTTTARILAKVLNCELRYKDPDFYKLGEPCNQCQSCLAIDSNSSFDLVEIDAASNRGIDEIRSLKDSLNISPSISRFKIYIIDEVHMLTGPAFNALLKTLEEPPKHVVFILATTEYEKLPATITSRAQRFLFKKLPSLKILEKLKNIVLAEKIEIDDESLELIARSADGSLRDAESILDQLSSTGEKITLKLAEELIGRPGLKSVDKLTEFILKTDLKSALNYLRSLEEEGYNSAQFTKDLIHYLRKVVALHFNPDLEMIFRDEFTDEEIKRLKFLASQTNPSKHILFLKSLIRAYAEIRYSPFGFVPLEVVLLENLRE